MGINFERALSVHAQALDLRSRRAEILATNLANADTPNYQARDLDFAATLAQAREGAGTLEATHAGHLQPLGQKTGQLLYRTPAQMSLDGNTVEAEQEKAVFADNALRYQASLRFMSSRIKGLMTAIKGE